MKYLKAQDTPITDQERKDTWHERRPFVLYDRKQEFVCPGHIKVFDKTVFSSKVFGGRTH